jgi:hypothetical protein
MNEEKLDHLKLTNREFACLMWNTMYPERRSFGEISDSAKDEWEKLARITRSITKLDGVDCITEIKEILKPQL